MKKNKFIINNSNKIKTLIPALTMIGMINCNAMTFPKKVTPESEQLIELISLGHETLNYKNESNYSTQKAMNTLKAILSSDLNKIVISDAISNEDVQSEVIQHLSNMTANTLQLARMYKSLKNDTVNKSGLSIDQIYKSSNALKTKVDTQHYLHTTLDRLNLVRLRADEDALNIIFKLYKHENLAFSINSSNDVRDETNFLLYAMKEDIRTFMTLGLEKNEGNDNSDLIEQVYSNLNELEYLTTQAEFTQANCKYIFYLIQKTAELLPAEIFGTYSMRLGLVIEYATQHGMNTMMTNLEFFGFNIENLTNKKTQKNASAVVHNEK